MLQYLISRIPIGISAIRGIPSVDSGVERLELYLSEQKGRWRILPTKTKFALYVETENPELANAWFQIEQSGGVHVPYLVEGYVESEGSKDEQEIDFRYVPDSKFLQGPGRGRFGFVSFHKIWDAIGVKPWFGPNGQGDKNTVLISWATLIDGGSRPSVTIEPADNSYKEYVGPKVGQLLGVVTGLKWSGLNYQEGEVPSLGIGYSPMSRAGREVASAGAGAEPTAQDRNGLLPEQQPGAGVGASQEER